MGYKVVITCDRTMASNYHGLMFLGFSACIPTGMFPDWLYYPIFCPTAPSDKEGRLLKANYGMRKIEAALIAKGFKREDVIVAHPDHLDKVIGPETEILSISSNDPLGIGPATSTFTELWGGEGRMAQKLRQLIKSKPVQTHKPFIFLGGPGAWQFSVKPEKQKEYGIGCTVIGEGEVTAPKLFKKVLEGKTDEIKAVENGEFCPDEDIADILGGSITGLIEVTRGCARSCAFCVPTVRKVRSRPHENVLNEIKVNIASGTNGALLHGEDILLYKSDGLKVNSEAVVDLFKTVTNAPGVKWVGASHASLSSAASAPEAVKGISEVLKWGSKEHPSGYFQVGIETGSPRLIDKHMRGKAYPYPPEEWPDVVREGMKVLHENNIVSSATMILGLPGEEEEDIQKSIDLVDSLRGYKSIIVPLLFTAMETSRLEYTKSLYKHELTTKHHELLAKCWDHNLDWLPAIWKMYGRNSSFFVDKSIKLMMKLGTRPVRWMIKRSARKKGVNM